MLVKYPGQEIVGKSREPVLVGHHNLVDRSRHRSLQKGLQALTLEVDATGDVCDDIMGGVAGLEHVNLPLEVVSLP